MIPAARKIEIAKINGTFTVRKINQTYIDHLVKDFENNGQRLKVWANVVETGENINAELVQNASQHILTRQEKIKRKNRIWK